ncbi:MAG: type II toxin-antitoxin system PemK/MazF family toxin [Gammaproteobacteria bacterium]
MGVVIKRFDVFLVALDPTVGHEIQKTRPCLVVSPDEINRIIGTVIVAPMTKGRQSYPTRVPVKFKERAGSVALDQIRAVDKSRLINKVGVIKEPTRSKVLAILQEMFAA